MRRIQIVSITPSVSPGTPSTITVGLDFTPIFHGREWIDGVGTRSPFYTYTPLTAPLGTGQLLATTFEIVENTNAKYNGRYTVYTKAAPADLNPSDYSAGQTTIRIIDTLATDGAGAELTTGYITNISTFLLTVTGESSILLLEQQNNDDRTVELMGHRTSGWAEILLQNQLRMTQCFAGPSAPTTGITGQKPFLGQLWWNTLTNTMMVKPTAVDTNDWIVLNGSSPGGPGLAYRHTQSVASLTWSVMHNLGVASPFVAEASFFVDTGGGVYKPILPSDVTYNSANQLTATFSGTETGYAIVRSAP